MNIKTFSDMRKDKEGQQEQINRQSYVGGEKSGLLVEDEADVTSQIIKKAHEESQRQRPQNIEGRQSNRLTITLYREGFVLSDDNIYKPYSEPQNKQFLEDLYKGNVPKELYKKYQSDLDLEISDRKQEDYKLSAQPVETFAGKGFKLGETKTQVFINPNAKDIGLKEGEKTCTLQIRMSNGDKKSIQVNLSTQFTQIREYVQSLLRSNSFQIKKVFPQIDITMSTETIEQLDLIDSTVNVILK